MKTNALSTLKLVTLTLIALAAAGVSSMGCLPAGAIRFSDVAFNERFTLDRQPLNASQQMEDPESGPYRRGDGEIASYIYPTVDGADKLIQSDCLWLAHESGAGDDLLLNWEAVITLYPKLHDDLGLAEGDEDVTACRVNDPITRQPSILTEGEYEDPEDGYMAVNLPQFSFAAGRHDGDPLVVFEYDIALENGYEFLGANLDAVPTVLSNPDRVCDDFSQVGMAQTVTAGVLAYDGTSDNDDHVTLCTGPGRRIRPDDDMQLDVGVSSNGTPLDQMTLGRVMTAGDGAQLRRPLMILSNADVRWSTSVNGSRWGENFSTTLEVDEVRLLRRNASGENYLTPADLDSEAMCVRASSGSADCLWVCPVTEASDGAAVFRPSDGQCQYADNTTRAASLTPTVDIDLLEAANAPIDQPLVWEFEPSAPQDLLVEFRLLTDFAPIGIRTDELKDLGDIPPGERHSSIVTVRNVGLRSVNVDDISFDAISPNPGDFSFEILTDPAPVPVPIDLVDNPETGMSIGIAEEFETFPALEFIFNEEQKLATAMPTYFEEETFYINEEPVTFIDNLALTCHPEADFQMPLAKYVSRPIQLVAYFPRRTPFVLQAGDTFRVRLNAEPASFGEKAAYLRIDYSDAGNPGDNGHVLTTAVAYGMTGPIPGVLPQALVLSDLHSGSQSMRNALIVNDGDQSLEIYDIGFDGDDVERFHIASSHPSTVEIPSAGSEVFTVEYLDSCPPAGSTETHEAELIFRTNAGDLSVSVFGWSTGC